MNKVHCLKTCSLLVSEAALCLLTQVASASLHVHIKRGILWVIWVLFWTLVSFIFKQVVIMESCEITNEIHYSKSKIVECEAHEKSIRLLLTVKTHHVYKYFTVTFTLMLWFYVMATWQLNVVAKFKLMKEIWILSRHWHLSHTELKSKLEMKCF